MTIQALSNVGVYHDSGTSLYHFDQLNNHSYRFNQKDYFQYPVTLDNFLNSKYKLKFAGFHVPFPCEQSWLERFHTIRKHVAHVFVFCSELHASTVTQLIGLDYPNTSIFVCGTINHEFVNAKIYHWMDWFVTTSHFYKNIKPTLLLEKLTHSKEKSYCFDVLLGCKRNHRDFVYDYIHQKQLNDKIILSYHQRADLDLRTANRFIFEDEDCEFVKSVYTHTVDPVRYHNHAMTLSQVIPLQIYNNSYYSLIAETNFDNQFNFYTEKIVKPILGQRLFIVIAGRHYLQNLRNMGFKTFDNVIDESYDNETDHHLRWKMAMQQFERLALGDPKLILKQIEPIVSHNYKVMMTKKWYDEFSVTLANDIRPYLTIDQTTDHLQDFYLWLQP